MKTIPLTQGKVAIVDDEDYERLNKHKWYANKIGNIFYAVRAIGKYTNRKKIWMHREILNAKTGQQTDHKNQNGLNNQKNNLRLCSVSQNAQNRRPQKGKISKYKGISWHKYGKKWQAHIKINNQSIYLGLFVNERKAAKAYNNKAKELFGEFAHLNIL